MLMPLLEWLYSTYMHIIKCSSVTIKGLCVSPQGLHVEPGSQAHREPHTFNLNAMLQGSVWHLLTTQSKGGEPMAHSQIWPTTCFVNKVLLAHSHDHSFIYHL
jgi:hypothetical protein